MTTTTTAPDVTGLVVATGDDRDLEIAEEVDLVLPSAIDPEVGTETVTVVESGMTLVRDTKTVGTGPLTLVHAVRGIMLGPRIPRVRKNQRYV